MKGRTSHPLAGLLEAVTLFVSAYEERHVVPIKASPAAVLRYLMDQRRMRQVDLADRVWPRDAAGHVGPRFDRR